MKTMLSPKTNAEWTGSALSISQLNTTIRSALGDAFPIAQWVHGEVSGLRVNSSGHVYFDLVEKDEEKHSVIAKISCFLPAGLARFIQGKLRAAGFEGLKDDIEIQVLADVTFYSPYGKLSLTIRDIEPAFTLGKMAQARQQIIEDLTRRGLLQKNQLREMPIVSLRVGLVTSEGSAAYHDFLKTLQSSGFGFTVFLAPSTMQGEGTEKSVTQALSLLGRQKDLDVIALVRGGGSKSDLAWFDNLAIAESIARSSYPILTGIGHEIDISIADMVAHTHFKTPTAVAEFLVSRVDDFQNRLVEDSQTICQMVQLKVQEASHLLEERNSSLRSGVVAHLGRERERVLQIVKQFRWARLTRLFETANEQIMHREKHAAALHPIQILKRGFSLTRGADGKFLKSVKSAQTGENISTYLADGKLLSEVQKVVEGAKI